MARRESITRLYELLDELGQIVSGRQKLKDYTGYMDWPDRGVYFFFTSDEHRDADGRLRITHIGTRTVSEKSSISLWDQLRAHRGARRGTYEGGGNHRGFVFRERVGETFAGRDPLNGEYPHWGEGSSTKRERRLDELEVERRVNDYLRDLPFLWLNVDDEPKAENQQTYIERNTIALLSNYQRETVNAHSDNWLGNHSRSKKIRESGLWNINHVDGDYDPKFLDLLRDQVEETSPV